MELKVTVRCIAVKVGCKADGLYTWRGGARLL